MLKSFFSVLGHLLESQDYAVGISIAVALFIFLWLCKKYATQPNNTHLLIPTKEVESSTSNKFLGNRSEGTHLRDRTGNDMKSQGFGKTIVSVGEHGDVFNTTLAAVSPQQYNKLLIGPETSLDEISNKLRTTLREAYASAKTEYIQKKIDATVPLFEDVCNKPSEISQQDIVVDPMNTLRTEENNHQLVSTTISDNGLAESEGDRPNKEFDQIPPLLSKVASETFNTLNDTSSLGKTNGKATSAEKENSPDSEILEMINLENRSTKAAEAPGLIVSVLNIVNEDSLNTTEASSDTRETSNIQSFVMDVIPENTESLLVALEENVSHARLPHVTLEESVDKTLIQENTNLDKARAKNTRITPSLSETTETTLTETSSNVVSDILSTLVESVCEKPRLQINDFCSVTVLKAPASSEIAATTLNTLNVSLSTISNDTKSHMKVKSKNLVEMAILKGANFYTCTSVVGTEKDLEMEMVSCRTNDVNCAMHNLSTNYGNMPLPEIVVTSEDNLMNEQLLQHKTHDLVESPVDIPMLETADFDMSSSNEIYEEQREAAAITLNNVNEISLMDLKHVIGKDNVTVSGSMQEISMEMAELNTRSKGISDSASPHFDDTGIPLSSIGSLSNEMAVNIATNAAELTAENTCSVLTPETADIDTFSKNVKLPLLSEISTSKLNDIYRNLKPDKEITSINGVATSEKTPVDFTKLNHNTFSENVANQVPLPLTEGVVLSLHTGLEHTNCETKSRYSHDADIDNETSSCLSSTNNPEISPSLSKLATASLVATGSFSRVLERMKESSEYIHTSRIGVEDCVTSTKVTLPSKAKPETENNENIAETSWNVPLETTKSHLHSTINAEKIPPPLSTFAVASLEAVGFTPVLEMKEPLEHSHTSREDDCATLTEITLSDCTQPETEDKENNAGTSVKNNVPLETTNSHLHSTNITEVPPPLSKVALTFLEAVSFTGVLEIMKESLADGHTSRVDDYATSTEITLPACIQPETEEKKNNAGTSLNNVPLETTNSHLHSTNIAEIPPPLSKFASDFLEAGSFTRVLEMMKESLEDSPISRVDDCATSTEITLPAYIQPETEDMENNAGTSLNDDAPLETTNSHSHATNIEVPNPSSKFAVASMEAVSFTQVLEKTQEPLENGHTSRMEDCAISTEITLHASTQSETEEMEVNVGTSLNTDANLTDIVTLSPTKGPTTTTPTTTTYSVEKLEISTMPDLGDKANATAVKSKIDSTVQTTEAVIYPISTKSVQGNKILSSAENTDSTNPDKGFSQIETQKLHRVQFTAVKQEVQISKAKMNGNEMSRNESKRLRKDARFPVSERGSVYTLKLEKIPIEFLYPCLPQNAGNDKKPV